MPSASSEQISAVEIVPLRLFWCSRSSVPRDTANSHYFSVDASLTYEPFSEDFGPLCLSMTYRYCKMLEAKLNNSVFAGKRIIHCCGQDAHTRANAACLMGLYQVVVLGKTAKEAYQPFRGMDPPFLPFRDAITGPCSFNLSILDCLEGMQKAIELGWFNFDTFDLHAYENLGNAYKCDATWVVPNKFLAFAGPAAAPRDEAGCPCFTPEDCVPIFRRAGVGVVVRLNSKQYDRRRFTEHGIRHADLFFTDGSCPSWDIISKFLCIAESEPGPVAVHCKAGLGRTCTLIGLYAMKHFQFPARSFIGWNRICRPGSVLGPQQQFLVNMQDEMFKQGLLPRPLPGSPAGAGALKAKPGGFSPKAPVPDVASSLLLLKRNVGQKHQDPGQGERLCGARRGCKAASLVRAEAVHASDEKVGDTGIPSLKAKLPPLMKRPMGRQASAPELAVDKLKPLESWAVPVGALGRLGRSLPTDFRLGSKASAVSC